MLLRRHPDLQSESNKHRMVQLHKKKIPHIATFRYQTYGRTPCGVRLCDRCIRNWLLTILTHAPHAGCDRIVLRFSAVAPYILGWTFLFVCLFFALKYYFAPLSRRNIRTSCHQTRFAFCSVCVVSLLLPHPVPALHGVLCIRLCFPVP